MTLRLLFVAGDVGGARALHPVIELASLRGIETHVIWHGFLVTMPPVPGAVMHHLDAVESIPVQARRIMAAVRPDSVIFATSVKDDTARQFAAAARQIGIPLAHLLDNWTSYRERLVLGDQFIAPDLYAVMDDVARSGATADGIAPKSIVVTGTPALANLPAKLREPAHDPLRLIFVSEPVFDDQGDNPSRHGYRGYVETEVLALAARVLAAGTHMVRLDILPHPREDRARLAANWAAIRGPVTGDLIAEGDRQAALSQADGVIGMASILLYEMWLRGWPVASLQPGLRLDGLRMLAAKPGLLFADDPTTLPSLLTGWANGISSYEAPAEAANERAQHRLAAAAFMDALFKLVAKRGPRIIR